MSPAITGSGGKGSPLYRNPFHGTSVSPARIDMGVDYFGRPGDPIYALGRGTVVESYPSGTWPGNPGGFVGYRLDEGPQKGRIVYVAEDIAPQVHIGDKVTSSTVVARWGSGGAGSACAPGGPCIETGFASTATPSANTLAAQQHEIPGGGDPGAWTTLAGAEFSNLLASTGAPAGIPTGPVHGPGGGIITGFKFGKGGPTGTGGVSGKIGGNYGNQGEGANCLLGIPASNGVHVPLVGTFGGFNGLCLITKKRARTFAGIGLVLAGGGLLLVGSLILAAYGLKGTGAGKAAGRATEAAGAAIAAVPGGEAAGAATVAAGHAKVKRSERTAERRTERRERTEASR